MAESELSGHPEMAIYEDIHRAIAEHRLKPGAKLAEETLAEIFSVSRGRVRKVLLLLSKENIVQLKPNRGAFVWLPTVEEARNVLEARRAVELYLIKEVPQRASRAQIKKLRKIIQQEQNATKVKDNDQRMRLSGEFHLALAECAGNPILSDFLSGLVSRCYLILATYERIDRRCCPDHANIVKFVEKKDSRGAFQAMKEHFFHMEEELDLTDKTQVNSDLRDVFSNS